jgi:hypothetical protein
MLAGPFPENLSFHGPITRTNRDWHEIPEPPPIFEWWQCHCHIHETARSVGYLSSKIDQMKTAATTRRQPLRFANNNFNTRKDVMSMVRLLTEFKANSFEILKCKYMRFHYSGTTQRNLKWPLWQSHRQSDVNIWLFCIHPEVRFRTVWLFCIHP